jgi:hypothetical protein
MTKLVRCQNPYPSLSLFAIEDMPKPNIDQTTHKLQCQVCGNWEEKLRGYSLDIEDKCMCTACAQEYCELQDYR